MWPRERRVAYANDLEHREHLRAVKAGVNGSKGDRSPDQWKPPRQEFWCEYATNWLRIKKRWGLSLTEKRSCSCGQYEIDLSALNRKP